MRSRRQSAQMGVGRNGSGSRSAKRAPPSDALVDGGKRAGRLSAHHFIFPLFFFASLVIGVLCPRAFPLVPSLSLQRIQTTFHPSSSSVSFSFAPSFNNILAMIMVQKPVHLHSSPSTYHRRHPSAPPVVHVQPTHVPGLFSLSKPHPVTPPRSQQQHQNTNRQSRLSNKSKPTSNARASQPTTALTAAQPLLSEDLNKLSTPGRPATKPHTVPVTSSVTPEKHPRGRQNLKHGKDKSKLRYAGDSYG